MKNIGSRRGWVRTALTGYRASRISVPRTWVPRQEPRWGTFVMVIPYPSTSLRPVPPKLPLEPLPYPPPIYSRCAERPGVQSLCLEEFLETLLSSDQGGRDFSWPTTSTAKREPRQRGRTSGRVGSRLYRWVYYPWELAHMLTRLIVSSICSVLY